MSEWVTKHPDNQSYNKIEGQSKYNFCYVPNS